MKRWVWQAALVGVWAAALAVVVVSRTGGRPARPPTSVEMSGPDVAMLAALEAKHRLTDEVIAGRLSLVQAAAAFRRVDAQAGRPHGAVLAAFPRCTSEEEAYYRSVICWASVQAPRDRVDELIHRFQAELDARLREADWQLADP